MVHISTEILVTDIIILLSWHFVLQVIAFVASAVNSSLFTQFQ